jgi:beta-N-acetylhexosaminidase
VSGTRPTRQPLLVALLALLVAAMVAPAAAAQPRPAPPPHAGTGLIESTLARMTLEEKVGQLFWTRAYGASAHDTSYAAQNQATYGVDTPAQVVEKYHLGGVLYFAWAGNTNSPQQIAELSNGLQEVALSQPSGVPLSLSIDQEGGIVARMLEPATVFPGNMALGATRDPELAAEQWRITGAELRAVGVNTNFAPVADVNTNAQNPVIGVRSFGEDPALVGELATIATRELQGERVSATLKHFPGHGDTEVDSHYGLPIVTYDRQTLEDIHLAPFADAITAAPDAIMTAHMIVEAVDPDLPATLSQKVLTGLLREEMGYEGVIVTDSLDMAGVREFWGDDRVPVLALQAGADVLLNPPAMDVAYDAVLEAVRSGELREKRIDESVRRILRMKLDRGMFHDAFTSSAAVDATVGIPDHLAVADEIADRATTLVRNEDATLPLDPTLTPEVLVAGPPAGNPTLFGQELTARGFTTTVQTTAAAPTPTQRAAAVAAARDADVVVVPANNAWRSAAQQQFIRELVATGTPVVVVGTRDAYDISRVPDVDAFVATYGNRAVSLRAAARVLVGEVNPSGLLPVTIPTADGADTLYPYGHGLSY